MSALHTQYLTEIIEAHREGLRILRELAAQETDPAERRRLAIALVRARPIQDPQPDDAPPSPPSPPSAGEGAQGFARADEGVRDPAPHATPAPNEKGQATPERPPQSEIPTLPVLNYPRLNPSGELLQGPPAFRDCTHPALPPYPGMHIKQLLKRARSA